MSDKTENWLGKTTAPQKAKARKNKLREEEEQVAEKLRTMREETKARHPDWFDGDKNAA